jgi:hypothetical protein
MTMLIIAHHNISDPQSFWSAAEQVTKNLPANLKVLSVYPSMDGKTGTCLWEGDSAQSVQTFLDANAAQYAKNTCYEVNVEKSMGLPAIDLVEAGLS